MLNLLKMNIIWKCLAMAVTLEVAEAVVELN
jgi:hypothetical protein